MPGSHSRSSLAPPLCQGSRTPTELTGAFLLRATPPPHTSPSGGKLFAVGSSGLAIPSPCPAPAIALGHRAGTELPQVPGDLRDLLYSAAAGLTLRQGHRAFGGMMGRGSHRACGHLSWCHPPARALPRCGRKNNVQAGWGTGSSQDPALPCTCFPPCAPVCCSLPTLPLTGPPQPGPLRHGLACIGGSLPSG